MLVRSADDAKADIGHHFSGLADLGRNVHAFFLQNCRALAPLLEPRSRATVYRDIFVRELRDYCDSTLGAHLYRKNQLVLIGLESRYVLRVKRLSDGFSVGVSPTRASKQYDGNKLPEYANDLFADSPDVTLLYLGWSVSENAPDQINLYLVCNDYHRNVLWSISLSERDDGCGLQQPLPIDSDDENDAIRVVVKGNKRKANG